MERRGLDSGAAGPRAQPESQSGAQAGRMREAIAAAMSGKASREELQAAAREMVRGLGRADQTPEKALLQIKSVLAEAGLKPNYADGDAAAGREGALYRDVIAWSIKAYYEDKHQARDLRPDT